MSRSRRIRLLFAAVVAVQLALIPTRAQSPRPMGIVDLLSVPRLADPRLSPDGREVVFTKSDADGKTGSETRLTSGDFSVTSYTVSDDGRKIVVHRQPTPLLGSRADSEVWVMNADGSGGIQVTKNTVQETNGSLSPDDAQVLFLAGANARFEDYYNGRLF